MAVGAVASTDLIEIAQHYVDRFLPGRSARSGPLRRLAALPGRVDDAFCRRVADHFDRQPRFDPSPALASRYRVFQAENLRQFELIADAGIRVQPWLRAGHPYRGRTDLREQVAARGTLFVFLTRDGHGPRPAHLDLAPHPMRAASGIRRGGVEFCHNDIFRAVHDVFGHLMFDYGMGPIGELRAAYCHLAMYSGDVHTVLFSEHVSQVCWFFYGRHLRLASGRLPEPGEPEWVAPARRPYAEQKVFACPPRLVAEFAASMRR